MRLLLAASLVALSIAAVGCSSKRVYPLTTRAFPATPPGAEVKLYVNEVTRPHVQIAHIQSFSDREQDTETVRRQLLDLDKRARKLGADAIVNVRKLDNRVRGAVVDEAVPFRAYRQGTYNLYMMRGTAIKFVEEGDLDAEAAATAAAGAEGTSFPGVRGRDPEQDLPMEVAPRGLAPGLP